MAKLRFTAHQLEKKRIDRVTFCTIGSINKSIFYRFKKHIDR
jgi:hypothetical protein